jgi:hypothetical protein
VLGALVLFFLSPLPVAIAGLGWGWMPAAVAAAFGCLLVAVLGTGRAAAFYGLTLGLPIAVMSYLVMLNRPHTRDDGAPSATLEWYPVGHVLAWAALWAGCLAGISLFATAGDIEGLRNELRGKLESFLAGGGVLPGMPGHGLEAAELNVFVELMVITFALATVVFWMSIAILNLWLAGHVTRISRQLQRPWPDLTGIELPRRLPVAFVAAVAATFLPGLFPLVASGFAFAILFAYMLIGLAIAHRLTRGVAARPLVLAAVYASLVVLFPFSNLLLALAGIAEPFSPLRRPPPPPTPPFGQISNR